MSYGYRFIHKDQMFEDSWTYGDWRQYICCVGGEGGFTQCARRSELPIWFGFGSFMFALFFFTGLFLGLQAPEAVPWERVIAGGLISVILLWPFFFEWESGYVLMKMVGPPNQGTRRVMPGEETE